MIDLSLAGETPRLGLDEGEFDNSGSKCVNGDKVELDGHLSSDCEQVKANSNGPLKDQTTSFDALERRQAKEKRSELEGVDNVSPQLTCPSSLILNPSEFGSGCEERQHCKSLQAMSSKGEQQISSEKQGQIKKNDGNCGDDYDVCCKEEKKNQFDEIRPSGKRYFILIMFIILQTTKSFQWICLASITNVVANFYNVDNMAVNWTTIMFMITYLVFALPVSWIMDSLGLRRSVLIGTFGVTLGVTIKCFTCHRSGFALSMFGHLIVGITEPFFFSSYAQLASVWFPDNQVALATAASLIGEQAGLALGFIIPPLVIGNETTNFVAIQRGLFNLFLIVAIISIANTICIVLFFDEEPKFAPGVARFKQKQEESRARRQSQQQAGATLIWPQKQKDQQVRYEISKRPSRSVGASRGVVGASANLVRLRKQSLRRASTISRVSQSVGDQMKLSAKFMSERNFIMLLIGFGLNQGVGYSIHTLLNQMIAPPVSLTPQETSLPNAHHEQQSNRSSLLTSGNDSNNEQLRPLRQQQQQQQQIIAIGGNDGAETNLIVGNAGLILIIAGLFGSALCGFLLDKYHKHKLTTVLVYLLTLLSMGALTVCLSLENETILYLAIIPLGFAQTGYASCAFDYGVELTYPKPELLSSTLLNMFAQLFGIPISLLGSLIVDAYGSQALGAFFCLALAIGFLVNCLQSGELRRQTAVNGRCQLNKINQKAHGVTS